jgi:hypothetical protein
MSTITRSATRTQRASDSWGEVGPLALIAGIGFILGLIFINLATGQSISPLVWYITRSAAMTTYILLWLSVLTGLSLTTKLFGIAGDAGISLAIHRLSTDLALAGVAIHVLTIAVDPTVPIGLFGALVPMVSDVRQPWSDLGILSAWGLVGIALSFPARRWIGKARWRTLHYLTFGFWALALIHGIGAGTDRATIWVMTIYIITTLSIVFMMIYRVLLAQLGPGSHPRGERRVKTADTRR